MTITAAADGSSLGNPGPMGWCWYVDARRWGAGGAKSGTNNIGELLAVAELLDATARAGLAAEPLRVLCDSQYVINSVTKWMPGWKRKGWRKADGKPVMNRELLERIDRALEGREVRFEWVKGHAGHPENEAADERARAVAEAYQHGRTPDEGPGFGASEHADGGPVADLPVATLTDDEREEDGFAELGGMPSGDADVDGSDGAAPNAVDADTDLDDGALFGDDFGLEESEDASAIVLRLERELLTDACRGSRSRLEELLHEDFALVTAAGSVVDRATTLAGIRPEPGLTAREHEVEHVAPNVALVRFIETDPEGRDSRRASLWVYERLAQNERAWQLRHHQITPIA